MESQTALAVPDEDNCIVVYSSTQSPQFAHTVIARCLGVPEHNVRVITRRLGGSFGGKGTKSMPVSNYFFLTAEEYSYISYMCMYSCISDRVICMI